MRRCKYFNGIVWYYKNYPEGTIELGSGVNCDKNMFVYSWDGTGELLCNEGIYHCYQPVEIDPYWKNIIDETNRRLNNE